MCTLHHKKTNSNLSQLKWLLKSAKHGNMSKIFSALVICILLQSMDCKTTATATPLIEVKRLSLNLFAKGNNMLRPKILLTDYIFLS